MESSPPVPPSLRVAPAATRDLWHHAVRVAFLTSLVAAATGVILHGLLGVSGWVVVPLLAFGGWVVGCHLPPAAPAAFQPGPGGSSLPFVVDSFGEPEWDELDWSDDLAA